MIQKFLPDIVKKHKLLKDEIYWKNLNICQTKQYKEKVVFRIIEKYLDKKPKSILDIGCANSNALRHYGKRFRANFLMGIDYDESIIETLKKENSDVVYQCNNLFDLKSNRKFDLIFLLDIIHEIYSLYGRVDIKSFVQHNRGIKAVCKAIEKIACLTKKRGGVILTDNVLCEMDTNVKVLANNTSIVNVVKFFQRNYPSKFVEIDFGANRTFEINSRDFCILLTQYNKIKKGDFRRWDIEKMEIHQYFTLKEYRDLFCSHHYNFYYEIGTNKEVIEEWSNDFTILEGLKKFPHKRVTILAVKQ